MLVKVALEKAAWRGAWRPGRAHSDGRRNARRPNQSLCSPCRARRRRSGCQTRNSTSRLGATLVMLNEAMLVWLPGRLPGTALYIPVERCARCAGRGGARFISNFMPFACLCSRDSKDPTDCLQKPSSPTTKSTTNPSAIFANHSLSYNWTLQQPACAL